MATTMDSDNNCDQNDAEKEHLENDADALSPVAKETITKATDSKTTPDDTVANGESSSARVSTACDAAKQEGSNGTKGGTIDVEVKVGIASYLLPKEIGFSAVLKARYSDFIVHEVDVMGNVARLTSLENNLRHEEEEEEEQTKQEAHEAKKRGLAKAEKTDVESKRMKQEETKQAEKDKEKTGENAKEPGAKDDTDADIKMEDEQEKQDEAKKRKLPETQGEDEDDGATKRVKPEMEEQDKQGQSNEKEKEKDEQRQEKEKPKSSGSSLSDGGAHEALSKVLGDDTATSVIDLLKHWENVTPIGAAHAKDAPPKCVTLPLISDKDKRRAVHHLVREVLSAHAVADTCDETKCIRIWHKRFERNMPNWGKFGGRGGGRGGGRKERKPKPTWPMDRPDFLQFVLYKENLDTAVAVKDIGHAVHLPQHQRGGGRDGRGGRGGRGRDGRGARGFYGPPPPTVGYAGMKDKRGVTTQFCTLRRKTPKDLLHLNRRGGRGGGFSSRGGVGLIRVGCFQYVDNELKLGMLKGNRFDIALRNVRTDATAGGKDGASTMEEVTATVRKAAELFRRHGFINYFGMQRFGKFHDTHDVGIAVLKGDFQRATEIILREKPIANEPPKVSEARRRWTKRFDSVEDKNDTKAMEDAERQCARAIQRDLGRFMVCEVSIVSTLARRPCDYKAAFQSIAKNMRLMFLHAYQSYVWNRMASHRIDAFGGTQVVVGDLVLVEDKEATEGGSGTSGLKGKTVKMVDEADVSNGAFQITDVVLPMIGTKVSLPSNTTKELVDQLLREDGLTLESFDSVQDKDLVLGGDYRKLICRPNDVDFEIKTYTDPFEPLIETDLMKVTGTKLDKSKDGEGSDKKKIEKESSAAKSDPSVATAANLGEKESATVKEPACERDKASKGTPPSSSHILGLVVGFTLPPSTYATIALRELMKRPTASEYQRELQLDDRTGGNNEDLAKYTGQQQLETSSKGDGDADEKPSEDPVMQENE